MSFGNVRWPGKNADRNIWQIKVNYILGYVVGRLDNLKPFSLHIRRESRILFASNAIFGTLEPLVKGGEDNAYTQNVRIFRLGRFPKTTF